MRKKTRCENLILALVLALVMSMSLVTISNAAFDDADEIDYTEAVDVLNAVGVLEGSAGKFSPKGDLTRSQACKIIAYLDLGKDIAEALPALQVFSDVPANNWAAKYVAYCADAGYVSGVGGGKFDPDAKVTGYQFGKMLLCVLGYDADYEQFTGSSWEINVAKKMKLLDLADKIEKAGSLALTREEAAQYALNALETPTVTASKGTTTTVNGVTVVTGASAATVNTAATAIADAIYGDNDAATANTVELGEQLYDGKLKRDASGVSDGMKRPAHTWEYKGEDVGKYGDTADKTFVITKTDGAKDSLGAWLKSINEDYYVTASTETTDELNTALSASVLFVNGAGKAASSYATSGSWGKGDVVEVFETSGVDNKISKIVVTQSSLYEITKVDTQVNSTDAKNDVKAYLTLKALGGSSVTVNDTDIVGYAAATYVEDAYIAAVVSGTDVLSSYVVKPATEGSVSDYNGADRDAATKFTVNGTTYEKATKANVSEYVSGDFEGTYAVYTDANGYLLGIVEVEASQVVSDAVYVVSTWAKTGTDNYDKETTKSYAQLVDMNGLLSEVLTGYTTTSGKIYGMIKDTSSGRLYAYTEAAISAAGDLETSHYYLNTSNEITAVATADTIPNTIVGYVDSSTVTGLKFYTRAEVTNMVAGNVFTTEENSDDYIELKAYADTDSVKVGSIGSVASKAKDTNKYSAVSINGGTNNVYFVSDTKFIIVEGTQGEAEVTVKTGADATYTVTSTTATVIANKDGNNYEAAYVIIPTADYSGSTSSDVIYVNSATAYTVDGGKIIKAFDMDGKEIEVKIASSASVSANKFYTIDSTNSKGVSTLGDPMDTLSADVEWDEDVLQLANVKFVNLYNDKFSLTDGSKYVNDIDAASVVIIDKHEKDNDEFQADTTDSGKGYDGVDNYTDADNYQDTYSGNVTTLADMNSLTSDGYTVTFSVSIDEDGAQLIVIKEVSKTITA